MSGSVVARRGMRARKVNDRLGVVSEADQQQAVAARLEALENDAAAPDAAGADSDDEFVLPADSDADEQMQFGPSSSKRKKGHKGGGGGKRKTRGMVAERSGSRGGPRSFATLLEEANLEEMPPGVPTYLTAAVGPPTTASPRKFCSVCGNIAGYKCIRCASRFCSKKCLGVHTETRCLKFLA